MEKSLFFIEAGGCLEHTRGVALVACGVLNVGKSRGSVRRLAVRENSRPEG